MRGEHKGRTRIGIVSDLHGRLPKAAAEILRSCDHIICAGDFESEDALSALERLGPLTAVRGNMDRYGRVRSLPRFALCEIGGIFIYVIHDLSDMDIDPEAAGVALVVHGHTHVPSMDRKGSCVYVNPGSVTRPRKNSGSTLAVAELEGKEMRIEHHRVR